MQLRPDFHQPSLPPRQETSDQVDRVETEDRRVLLVVGVEMWHVMRSTRFRKHANNYLENRLISGAHYCSSR